MSTAPTAPAATTPAPAAAKPKKKKGPVRTEAVVPLVIVLAIVWAYFFFFFDGHLRRAVEYGATAANGAEVDVAGLRTSFVNARLQLTGLQVTSKQDPARNSLEAGSIAVDFSWDALLRLKLVADEVTVDGVAWDTARSSPGRVLPEKQPEQQSFTDKLQDQVAARSKGSGLARIVDFVKTFDAEKTLGELKELGSVKKAKELQAQAKTQLAELGAQMDALEKAADLGAMQKDLDKINVKSKNPAELKQSLDALMRLKTAGEQKATTVKSSVATVRQGLDTVKDLPASLQASVAQDRKALEAKLDLPDLDAQGLTTALFGDALVGRVAQLRGYVALARKYMPAGKAKKPDDTPKPQPHAVGQTFHFPITRGYPSLWLRHGRISGGASADGKVGAFEGELHDLATDQSVTGKPFVLEAAGDLPQQGLSGVSVALTMDHRTATPVETMRLHVGSFPVAAQTWAQSDSFQLGITRARGAADAEVSVGGDTLDLTGKATLREATFTRSAKSQMLADVLARVTGSLSTVAVSAKVVGPWDKPEVTLESSLGTALTDAFEAELKDQLGRARGMITARIEEQLAPYEKQLQDQVGAGREKLEQRLGGVTGKLDGVQKAIDDKRKDAEAALKKAGGDKLKSALGDQAKKLKLP